MRLFFFSICLPDFSPWEIKMRSFLCYAGLRFRLVHTYLTLSSFGDCTFVANRRAEVIDWLCGLLPEFDLSLDSSDEELREYLIDGTALCYIADKFMPGVQEVSFTHIGGAELFVPCYSL
jgi:hypothetical protein